jgi:hypothetical protein
MFAAMTIGTVCRTGHDPKLQWIRELLVHHADLISGLHNEVEKSRQKRSNERRDGRTLGCAQSRKLLHQNDVGRTVQGALARPLRGQNGT